MDKSCWWLWGLNLVVALIAAPLLPGIINRVKAFFAGRKGPRVTQLYFDLAKLMRKSTVYSTSTTLLFRLTPWALTALTVSALLLLPVPGVNSPFGFGGDMILFLYLLGTGRLFSVLGAMETASSFEGMGSSRECQFSVLSEGAVVGVFGVLMLLTGKLSLSGCLNGIELRSWTASGTVLMLLIVAFYLVMLMECCRVPADDPETHLELTMIHEAMILDNSGADLGAILYASSVKLWVFFSFLALMILPELPRLGMWSLPLFWLLTGILAGTVGVVESVLARYRFLKVPQLLAGALCLTVVAGTLLMVFARGGK